MMLLRTTADILRHPAPHSGVLHLSKSQHRAPDNLGIYKTEYFSLGWYPVSVTTKAQAFEKWTRGNCFGQMYSQRSIPLCAQMLTHTQIHSKHQTEEAAQTIQVYHHLTSYLGSLCTFLPTKRLWDKPLCLIQKTSNTIVCHLISLPTFYQNEYQYDFSQKELHVCLFLE